MFRCHRVFSGGCQRFSVSSTQKSIEFTFLEFLLRDTPVPIVLLTGVHELV